MSDMVINGDCLEILRAFRSGSIDMCLTSPPYWGLRDYGTGPDQLGLEPTPELYIEHMTEVFGEVKRVLKPMGTLWLNIGDTYSSSPGYHSQGNLGNKNGLSSMSGKKRDLPMAQKCLCMIPERLAWSLIQDGWILRNKIIWYKPNGMPSSVKDRFSNKWEYVYLFSKERKYYFDLDAVREPHITESNFRNQREEKYGTARLSPLGKGYREWNGPLGKNPGDSWSIPAETRPKAKLGNPSRIEGGGARYQRDPRWTPPDGPNPGDYWSIPTSPFPEAHFAVFPEKLCEKPIKAGCPEGGVVFDPFCGAGTTGVVAKQLGRKFIGIDIKFDYCKMAKRRITQVGYQPSLRFSTCYSLSI